MRIRVCILAALAALAVGLTVWAHGSVYAQRNAVEVEQTVLRGDPAKAEGVALELRTGWGQYLVWNTHITAGADLSLHTDYTYGPSAGIAYAGSSTPGELYVDVTGMDGPTEQENEVEDQRGMQKPYNDVASRCPAGTEEYTETVRLRDYYEVYPLYTPGSVFSLIPESMQSSRYVLDLGDPELQLQELLREHFPIPVPEEATLTITIGKNAEGHVTHIGRDYDGNWLWPFDTCSVVREGGVYFLFSSPRDGEPLDTSLFPQGYGVYFLPVELIPTKTADGYDADAIRFGDPVRVCPVEPAVEYAYLCGGEEGPMYLFTRRDDTLTLTVLDEAGAPGQTLTVLEDLGEDGWIGNVCLREDFLLVCLKDDRFRVVETGGAACEAALEGTFRDLWTEDRLRFSLYGDAPLDYDGQRLAVGGELDTDCACFLALYGPEGLEYLGTYDAVSLQGGPGCSNLYPGVPVTVRLP